MTTVPGSLSAHQLSKSYSGPDGEHRPILSSLQFNISPGEFVCLLGPSGCGKTTLLRLLAGLETPDEGSLRLYPDQARVGMVFQQGGLFPWMSLEQNLRFVIGDTEAAADRVWRLLDQVGLTRHRHHYPAQVSGGMQQRLAVARSFAIEPHVLLMDEPFVHLDYQTRWQLQTLLLELWQAWQSAVLFVTHDVEEALLLADRILIMSAAPGRLVVELPVAFPRPRRLAGLKRDPAFHAQCAEIIDMIEKDFTRGPLS